MRWPLVPAISVVLENVLPRTLGGESTLGNSNKIMVGHTVVYFPTVIIPEVATAVISPAVVMVAVVSMVSTGLVHIVVVGFALRILILPVLVATTRHNYDG